MIRHVATALVLSTLSMSAGCASRGSVKAGESFTLTPGTSAQLPDASTLRYVGIANDSRCPPKVTCIRAGDADVQFEHLSQAGPSVPVVLNTERTISAALGPWQLQLLNLAAGAQPQVTIRLQER